MLKTLRAVIGTLDPTLQDVSLSKDLKDTFIIRRGGTEIIIQEGKLLNREILSSGTAEGIDVAMFLVAMATKKAVSIIVMNIFLILRAILKNGFSVLCWIVSETMNN